MTDYPDTAESERTLDATEAAWEAINGAMVDATSPSGVWMRTARGKAGRAPRHLTWDCGGGFRESACGLYLNADEWREGVRQVPTHASGTR